MGLGGLPTSTQAASYPEKLHTPPRLPFVHPPPRYLPEPWSSGLAFTTPTLPG